MSVAATVPELLSRRLQIVPKFTSRHPPASATCVVLVVHVGACVAGHMWRYEINFSEIAVTVRYKYYTLQYRFVMLISNL